MLIWYLQDTDYVDSLEGTNDINESQTGYALYSYGEIKTADVKPKISYDDKPDYRMWGDPDRYD